MQSRKKKTPVIACGICGESGHSSASHKEQDKGIYSGKRVVRNNVLGKKKR